MDTTFPDTTAIATGATTVGTASDAVVHRTKVSPFAFPRPTDDAVQDATIVIVDDEKVVTQLEKKYLHEAGFQDVRIVTDSTEALSDIETILPDLVLLDLHMTPVTGLEILEVMRRHDRTLHIPVIVVTSDTNEDIKVTALNLGANDFLTKPVHASELGSRVRNTLSAKVYRDLATEYSVRLESDVLCDALTGIANRRAFEYELKRRICEWNRQRTPMGLLMIDLDHFKAVNDVYGHPVGDRVLCDVAKVLTTVTREMDLVVRYGGEEYAVILPAATISESKGAAERVRHAIEDHVFFAEGRQITLSASVGVANLMCGDDANLLVQRADTALYAAKQHGRNGAFFHDGGSCISLTESADTVATGDTRPDQVHVLDRSLKTAKIAIVDDEALTIRVVKKHLTDAGFLNVVGITEANQAIPMIRSEEPDLVLLDVQMPEVNGLDILEELRRGPTASQIPVLIVTSDRTTRETALNLGASDFLEKPVDSTELLSRVRNTLAAKWQMDKLACYSSQLEQEVRLRTTELTASRREAIQCLARAAELRGDRTGQHVLRVGRYAAIVAEELGFSEERVIRMEHAAQLHDVGKIAVPDAILNKSGHLTADEWEVMMEHCTAGTRLLFDETELQAQITEEHVRLGADVFDGLNSPIMRMASLVVQTHHERWDGTGYPRGLSGTEIPIEGRIVAVADVFDALSTRRSYKEAIPLEQCFRMMEASRGSQFAPDVLDAFFRRKSEISRTYYDFADLTAANKT